MFNLNKKKFSKIDIWLLISVIGLVIFGLVMLYSATSNLNKNYMLPQIASTVLGFIVIVFLMFMDIDFLKKIYIPIYIISIISLIIVLLIGVGLDDWGAKSWIKLGPISFQPSEFTKIGILIFLARYIEIHYKDINKPKVLLKILFFAFLPVVLILRQPDAGTAMVYMFFIGVMLFSAGLDLRYIAGVLITGLVSLPFLYMRLDEFQKNRILNFIYPERDISNTGLQAYQGKIAIGSGKFDGRGFMNGIQSRLNYIPEKQTDYIYAVIVEELGFLGGLSIIGLYGMMLYRFIEISRKKKDVFSSLIIIGYTAIFLFHAFENIGMTLGVMPITGIPLPFFSYGGTFQLSNLMAIGLILSICVQKEPLDFM